MKRYFCIILTVFLLLALCGCSKTSVQSGQAVTLIFVYGEQDIQAELPEEEAQKVIEILDGNFYDPTASVPSCGFNEDICLKVGSRRYAVACDTCNFLMDCGNLRYFTISKDDMDYIHALFEQYGGYFPCV